MNTINPQSIGETQVNDEQAVDELFGDDQFVDEFKMIGARQRVDAVMAHSDEFQPIHTLQPKGRAAFAPITSNGNTALNVEQVAPR